MFATQILPETLSDDLKDDSHTVVGFIVFNDQKHEIKKGETKIGRDSSECSIVIENFTLSKVHAVIESDGIDETFIYDVGSTNQTRLGKKVLKPHCRYKLDNDNNITLGSVVVKFILPPDIGSDGILDKSSKENCNALDEYGDIFEMATQAIVPQSNSPYMIPVFETKSKNFQAFKIPNTKTKGSPEPSESVFDLQTQGRLESQKCQRQEITEISNTGNHNSPHDYPEIFSLSTQCQEHESQVVKENRCKVTSVQDVDEFKSFLNDDQDDVLCAVISLHSPKQLGNDDVEKRIKTEITENENLSQVLNAPTQVPTSITKCQEERDAEVNSLLGDKDFSTISSCLQIDGETSLSTGLKINDPANNCVQLIEDVIKTQEFRNTESQEKCLPDNLSQNKVTLTCSGGILTDNSMVQQKSHDEDFILTQGFEASLNKEPAIVIPESEDFSEDFMETQIYDVENERRTVAQAATKEKSGQLYYATPGITEGDTEDDFLGTQIFKEPVEAKKTDANYEKNVHSDDDDFIATQAFKQTVEAKRTDGNCEKNLASDDDFVATQTFKEQVEARTNRNFEKNVDSEDEDLVATQAFKAQVEAMRTDGNYEKNVDSEDEDLVATQAFKAQVEDMRTDGNYEKNVDSEDEDLVATQAFKAQVEAMRTDGNYEKNVDSEDEDLVATQAFKAQVEAKRTDRNYEKNVASNDEDFIPTQVVGSTETAVINSEDSRIEKSSRESSPDLLALGGPYMDSEDCIATQTFKPPECHRPKIGFSGFSEEFISLFFSEFKRDDSRVVKTKTPEIIESSGDETESDLEILLEKHKSVRRDDKILEKFQEIKSETSEIHKRAPISPSSDSSDIHVFKRSKNAKEIQSKRRQILDSSDSDATDCEEIEILNSKIRVKHESAEPVEFEETQVLTLTPPNNFVEKTRGSWMTDGESPKLEIRNDDRQWGPLSVEMPLTQDLEASVKERNEITLSEKHEELAPASSKLQVMEVEIDDFWRIEPSENKIQSPKKRPLSCNDVQVVPFKKSKTEGSLLESREKQFSKVVQTHDVAQIQPNRTRNSIRNFKAEVKTEFPEEDNTNIVRPTSRRKINTKRGRRKVLNCDITPYLTRGRTSRGGQNKETAVSENVGPKIESSTRVLRSSVSNSNSPSNFLKPPERRVSTRSGRRSSRRSNSEHLESPCFSVAFTGFDCPSFDGIITELGGKKVNDMLQCEVLVVDKVRRTVKFLCAIGLSLPITSPQWLVACKTEKKFLDPWNFILKDEEAENKWDFDLRSSLERSKRGKLLQGCNVFATKNTKPPVKELLAIVECCGGIPLFEPPEVWPKKTIIVSCLEDKKYWPAAKLRNVQGANLTVFCNQVGESGSCIAWLLLTTSVRSSVIRYFAVRSEGGEIPNWCNEVKKKASAQ